MQRHTILYAALGLALLGAIGVTGFGFVPTAHAQSVAPWVTASITVSGGTDQISFNGSGFTPGGTVNIYVYDSNTGALLQVIPVQANVGAPTTMYGTETQWVCTARPGAPYPGQPGQPGYPYPGQPGQPRHHGRHGQNCQLQTVSIPQTTSNGGVVATNFSLPYTTDELVVEGVDAATGVLSNQVMLPAPAASTPALSATITSYGTTNVLLISGAAYTYAVGSPLILEVVNPATGTVLATIPLSQPAYYPGGTLSASFSVPVPAYVTELEVLVFNPTTGWYGNGVFLTTQG